MNHLRLMPIIAILAAPLPVLAQDPSPSGDRIVSDPTYLPLQGQVYGASGYELDSTTSTTSNAGGVTSSAKSTGDTLSQDLEYGLTNDITLEARDSYQWLSNAVSPATGPRRTVSSDGFSDPTFGLTWRALDQRNQAPVDFDLSVRYSPNAISAQDARPFEDGTIARGGDSLEMTAAAGWETRQFTLQGYVAGTHFGSATVLNGQGVELGRASFWQPSVGIRTQTRLTNRLSLNVDGAYDFGRSSSALDANAIASNTEVGDKGNVGAALNYHFIPNRLVGSLGYSHTFYGASTVSFPLDSAANYTVGRSSDALTAGLKYVFR